IPVVTAACTLAGMIYCTVRLDWQLALVALMAAPVLFLVSRAYRPRMRRQAQGAKHLESSALGGVQEVLGALRVGEAFRPERRRGGGGGRGRDGAAGAARGSGHGSACS